MKVNNNNIIESKYNFYYTGEQHLHVSRGNTKIGNIPNINLLPGSAPITLQSGQKLTNIKGTCGKHCACCKNACYAIKLMKAHNNTCVPAWGENTLLLRNNPEQFKKELNEYLQHNIFTVMRYHTAGELETVRQLQLYCEIAAENKNTTFYLYTKAFDILAEFLNGGGSIPDNFVINLSEWHGVAERYIAKLPWRQKQIFSTFNVFEYDDGRANITAHCPAVDKDGRETGVTCASCRRCFTKGSKTAVYAH